MHQLGLKHSLFGRRGHILLECHGLHRRVGSDHSMKEQASKVRFADNQIHWLIKMSLISIEML